MQAPLFAVEEPQAPRPSAGVSAPLGTPVLACQDNLAFMEGLPDGQLKLIVTSPPYNIGDDYTWNLDAIRVPSKYPGKRHFKGPNIGKLSGNPKGKNPSDVWTFPNVKNNHPEKTAHPCQFPVELVERLVLAMTEESDAVFDPYMGVGSSIIAALKHGRAAWGCDLMPEYVETARDRVRQLRAGTLRTRPMNKPVYDPSLPNGGH
ncbi:MAG: site-specific DNA-methyltransferase [Gammaproteobacteria bacterium]|nr:site-specific DNA-methyltransferase [Gammaproteobacteria bacterium]